MRGGVLRRGEGWGATGGEILLGDVGGPVGGGEGRVRHVFGLKHAQSGLVEQALAGP